MKNALLGLVLVACGGAAANPPPSTTTSSSPDPAKSAEPKAAETSAAAPSSPPPTPAPAPAPASGGTKDNDVAGQWCGKPVSDAASCKGDDVMFLDLKVTGEAVTGDICEAYKKDCTSLSSSTFKSGALALGFKFDKGPMTGNFQLGPDGTLSGDFTTAKGKKVPKKLHRIK